MNIPHPSWKELPVIQKMTKYIWWKSSAEALQDPHLIVAQVMKMGDYHDVCLLNDAIGKEGFLKILEDAEPGELDERSWHYWHYRLGLAFSEKEIPPMPVRKFIS